MVMRIRNNWTLTNKITPEIIDAYMGDWEPDRIERIYIAARKAAADYGKRRLAILAKLSFTELDTLRLGDIAGEVTAYAEGFIGAIAYLNKELGSQLS